MSHSDSEAGRRRLLRRILITLSGGAIAFVATDVVPAGLLNQAVVTALVGGSIFIVLYLIEVDQRLDGNEEYQRDHARRVEDVVQKGFTRVSEATELFGLASTSPLGPETTLQLIRDGARIGQGRPELVVNLARAEMIRVTRLIRGLNEQTDLTYEGEDRDWLLTLTESATTSIEAVSNEVESSLWDTDLGQRYLRLQHQAIQRGVIVRRLFVADRWGDGRPLGQCQRQRGLGIDVRILDSADVPHSLAHMVLDVVLFDAVLAYETTPVTHSKNSLPPIVMQTRLMQQPDRVRHRVEMFSQLWSAASPLPVA